MRLHDASDEALQREMTRRQQERREADRRAREARRQEQRERRAIVEWFRSLPQEHLEILADDPDATPREQWFWSEVLVDAPVSIEKREAIELAKKERRRRRESSQVRTSLPANYQGSAFEMGPLEVVVAIVILLLVLGGER